MSGGIVAQLARSNRIDGAGMTGNAPCRIRDSRFRHMFPVAVPLPDSGDVLVVRFPGCTGEGGSGAVGTHDCAVAAIAREGARRVPVGAGHVPEEVGRGTGTVAVDTGTLAGASRVYPPAARSRIVLHAVRVGGPPADDPVAGNRIGVTFGTAESVAGSESRIIPQMCAVGTRRQGITAGTIVTVAAGAVGRQGSAPRDARSVMAGDIGAALVGGRPRCGTPRLCHIEGDVSLMVDVQDGAGFDRCPGAGCFRMTDVAGGSPLLRMFFVTVRTRPADSFIGEIRLAGGAREGRMRVITVAALAVKGRAPGCLGIIVTGHVETRAVTCGILAGKVGRIVDISCIGTGWAVGKHHPESPFSGAGGMGEGSIFTGVGIVASAAALNPRSVILSVLYTRSAHGGMIPVGGRSTVAGGASSGVRQPRAAPDGRFGLEVAVDIGTATEDRSRSLGKLRGLATVAGCERGIM